MAFNVATGFKGVVRVMAISAAAIVMEVIAMGALQEGYDDGHGAYSGGSLNEGAAATEAVVVAVVIAEAGMEEGEE